MSTFWTDYAENKLVDKSRGTAITYPSNWFIGLLSAAADGSLTELTGVNLARVAVSRSLLKWAGSQAPGSTAASSGTSHITSNNDDIQFGAATATLGTATFIGLFDALSGGNCWAYLPLTPLPINNGDTPTLDAGTVVFVVGEGSGCSNYLSNKLIDEFFRGQAWSWPATEYAALYTTAPGNGDAGVEVSGGSYARVAYAATMANWSGTQSAGSTGASSGTSGKSSNNNTITWPALTADWGNVVAQGWRDASSGGNLLTWGSFASPRSILLGGAPPAYAPAQQSRSFL